MTDVLASIRAALGDRYEVQGEVGRGGMATVFSAVDRQLGRTVAVKVIHPELNHLVGSTRFRREVSIAATLQHPNIVPVFESGEGDGLLFYTMPLVEGESLRERLRRETQLPLDEALRIATDVAEALRYAHGQGIVHRDVKPENILLHAGRAMVTDFGLARAIAQQTGDSITTSGLVAGTPGYMSPEQAGGKRDLDARTDVYSLACVLYEMLAGEAPFTGPSAQAIVAKQLGQPAPSIRVVRGTVPQPVDAIIQRGLAKVPADRYATVQEFAEALAHPSVRRVGPRRALVAAAATLAVAGGAGLLLFGPLKPGSRAPSAGSGEPVIRLGILPVEARGGADSGRVQRVIDLFVSEIARNRGLAVTDPATLAERLGANAASAGEEALHEYRRLGLQYTLRVTATATPRGLDLAYALTDAAAGDVVESGDFVDADGSRLPAQVRQASGRIAAALDLAAGGMAKGLDVQPFLASATKPAAVRAFREGIEYTYRFLPGGGEHFLRALALDHDFIAPRAFLISGLVDRGDTAAARAHMLVLDSLKPRATPFEKALIGWCEAVVRGDLAAMVRHDRVGLSYAPRNNIALFDLAATLWASGRAQEAMEPTRQALESGWRFGPLYTLWGELAIEAGTLSGLRDTLEEALRFPSPDPHVAALLEALALFDGDTSAARIYGAEFRAGVGEAGAAAGYAALAGSFRTLAGRAREHRRPETAAALLQRVVDGGVRAPILSLELARALAERGDRRSAESYYREAARSGPDGPDTLAVAGEVAELLGHRADARRFYTRYLEIAPSGPDAVRMRERLRVLGRPSGPP